ncbi:MAG TPA: hypothetical protein GX002_02525 [Clostridiales bacterium]|nr:hypothetical protein [Clostridiales bacterium]
MKLKKAYIFLLSFLTLSVLFSCCYFLSYQHALRQFNKRAVEQSERFAAFYEDTPAPVEIADTNTDNDNADSEDTVSAGALPEPVILPSTNYILEIYDRKEGVLTQVEQNPPADIVGLTREEVEKYLDEYMRDLTLSEYNKGLLSYELISFSDKAVKFRKSYDADMVPYRFYVVVRDGFVVVYNSDLKSVYEYTHIEAKYLPEEDRVALSNGIYINNIDELYALLESYTS